MAVAEGLVWRAPVHAAALMRTGRVVGLGIVVKNGLHFVDFLEPSAAPFDLEVMVE